MPENNRPIVEVSGVHKWFGDVHAPNDASLSIVAGTVYGLIGSNGQERPH